MSLKDKRYKRVYRTLSILLVMAFTALASYAYFTEKKLKVFESQNLVPQSEVENLEAKIKILNDLLAIDSYWMESKDPETSLEKYQSFLQKHNNKHKKIVSKRIERLQDIINSSKDDELTKINLRGDLRERKKINDSLVKVNDSISLSSEKKEAQLSKKIDSLKDTVKEKEAEIQRNETVKVISFRNDNKNLIHYIGETENEMANGNGIGIWNTGSIYRGNWINNKRHGKGEFVWDDGAKYEGDFVMGERTGEGVFYYSSGEKYEGEFKKGIRHGTGTLFDRDGNVSYKGNWKNDKPDH